MCSTQVSSIQATTERMEQTLLEVLRRLDQSRHQASPTVVIPPSLRLRQTFSSSTTILSLRSSRGSVSHNEENSVASDASDRILQRYLSQSGPCLPQRASSVDESPIISFELLDTTVGPLVSQIQRMATPSTLHLGAVYCDHCEVRTSGIYYGCEKGHHYLCNVCFRSNIPCSVNVNDHYIKTLPQQGQVVPTTRVSSWQWRQSSRAYCDSCGVFCNSESTIHYHCMVCRMGDYDICRECFNSGVHCFDSAHLLIMRVKLGSVSGTRHIPDGACHFCRDGKFIDSLRWSRY